MIGSFFALSTNLIDVSKLQVDIAESWHKQIIVEKSNKALLTYNTYDGYFIEKWKYKSYNIVVEGCIFDKVKEVVIEEINRIADNWNDHHILIKNFILDSDGDFVVIIYNEEDNRVVIFNDLLGGIPINYAHNCSMFMASRSISNIAINFNIKRYSRENIAEYLSLGYNIGHNTIFENIYKLEPGSYIECFQLDGILKINVLKSVEPDFSLKDPYNSLEEAANNLAILFLESCKSRIKYAIDNGYQIVNTMSGGCDSRTVLGGIEKFTSNYVNLTYEYMQDESLVAKKVLESINSQSDFIKVSFDNSANLYDSRLSYITDGKINCYTNSICYNDIQYIKSHIKFSNPVLYFGGFGGEYIRHPYQPSFQPIKDWGMDFNPSIKFTSKIVNMDSSDALSHFNEQYIHLEDKEVVSKYLYNEYYQNLVRCSGEDRTRMFFYTVQPLMGKNFILAVRNRFPLKWAGFRFYKMFLESIDKRLVTVELYGHQVNFNSIISMLKADIKQKQPISGYIRYFLKRYTNYEKRKKINRVPKEEFQKYLNTIDCSDIINVDFITNYYDSLGGICQLRLLTLLEYMNEIKNRT